MERVRSHRYKGRGRKEDDAAAVLGEEQQEKAAAEDSVKEISDEIGKIVTKMEQEMLERELKRTQIRWIWGEIHNGYRLRIIRPEPTLEQIARYEVMKKEGGCSCRKNGTVDCPAFGGTGKISERDGTGEKKSVGTRFTAGMAGFLGAGIFRATRTRRWGY